MSGDHAHQTFFGLCINDLAELVGKVKVIPADDAVFDQPIAAFGDFLFFFFGLRELARIADGNRTGTQN